MRVNAILSSTDGSGKKINTTITDLRQSQKSKAATLTQALNALTTNTYVSTQVNEINVDINGKTEPTLTLGTWSFESGTSKATITYNGDGQLFCNATKLARIDGDVLTVDSASFTGTIYATEGTNYASKTLEFSR